MFLMRSWCLLPKENKDRLVCSPFEQGKGNVTVNGDDSMLTRRCLFSALGSVAIEVLAFGLGGGREKHRKRGRVAVSDG